MRVVLPFTKIAPGVERALDATKWAWTPIYVGDADDSYWKLLNDLWGARETFCVVEHDVIVRPDTLDELAACRESWCGFPLPYLNGEYAGMGCVRFTDRLISGCPNALDDVARYQNDTHPPKHWCVLDHWLQRQVLPALGAAKHIHQPALMHYRPYSGLPQPSHGCCGDRAKEG